MFAGVPTQTAKTLLSLEKIVLALTRTSLVIFDPQITIVSHLTILPTKILHNDIFC